MDTTEEKLNEWMEQYEPIIYSEAPLANGALEVINSWKDEYELYYISARGRHLYEITEKWFQQQGVHYHHIELIGSHDKIEAVKKYKIDMFSKINTIMLAILLNNALFLSFYLILLTIAVRSQKALFACTIGMKRKTSRTITHNNKLTLHVSLLLAHRACSVHFKLMP
ncbi:hypothetical protein JS44_06095 [Anoxybacillus flavithermus]|uniref:Uncharacterized protein n=1 Tax=Anoxybacillus flavithermus TaxID=33934 RepID=A0A094J326_9BACL|nr:hypothetical protein JS44_06095 [Anoxybacillus flavithermus]